MPPLPLTAVFADLPDPRRETGNKLHRLTDILAIATCAVIGGAESWEAIAEYGRTKEAFFRRFLPLDNGIPSPDTFERVFAKLDPGGVRPGVRPVDGGGVRGDRAGPDRHRRQVGPGGQAGHGHRVPARGHGVGRREPPGPRHGGRRRTARTRSPRSPSCSARWTWPGRS